jgi:hypothetical protein
MVLGRILTIVRISLARLAPAPQPALSEPVPTAVSAPLTAARAGV